MREDNISEAIIDEINSIHNPIWNNKDDIAKAIHGLDIFTKNYCLNCKESEEKDDLIFRCKECPFNTSDEKCLIKAFAYDHKGDLDLYDFGAMGES